MIGSNSRLSAHRRRTGLVTALLAGSSLILAACDEPQQAARPAPPPPTVTVAAPLVKDIVEWDEFVGRFDAVNSVEIRARVSGYLESVHFRDGATVKQGDLLFVIDPRPFEIALEQSRAEVTRARARAQLAARELKRAEDLVKRGNVSRSVFDTRIQENRDAQAAIRLAEAQVKEAQLNLDYTQIKAPIDGRISRRLVSVGNLITGGSSGATLLTDIVSLDPIYFYFDASEADYLKYARLSRQGGRPSSREVSNPVQLSLMDEDKFVHRGRMNFVENRVDFNTGTVTGRAVVENPDGIFVPGLFAKLRLIASGEYEAVMIPDTAVATDQNRRFVYALDGDDVAQYRPVTLGPIIDGLRVIRTGLNGEDRVVINGLVRVRPGVKVTPQKGEIVAIPDAAEAAK